MADIEAAEKFPLTETRHKIRHRSGHYAGFENGARAGQGRAVNTFDYVQTGHSLWPRSIGRRTGRLKLAQAGSGL